MIADEQGNEVGRNRYTAWGETRQVNGESPTDSLYTGQRYDIGIGLYNYNARWYDPYLNRFLSPDSIIPDTYNPLAYDRYSYVANNPVNFIDQSGHCWGIASYIRGLPTYNTTCQNLEMALTIVQSDKTSTSDKVVAGAYISGEFIAHGTAAIYGGLLACGLTSATCYTVLTAGPGILEATCRYGKCADFLNTVGRNGDQYNSAQAKINTLRGLTGNGRGYEEWVVNNIGGRGETKVGNYSFDNKLGNVLMEVKSNSWEGLAPTDWRYSQFQNSIGRANSNAIQNGYEFLLRMLNRPPQFVLDWLDKKGYKYVIEIELWK